MDNDIVQGEEDRHTDDEEGEITSKTDIKWCLSLHPVSDVTSNMFCALTERDVRMLHEEEEKHEEDHRVPPHQQVTVRTSRSLHLLTQVSSSVCPLSSFSHLTFTYQVSSIQKSLLSSSLPTVLLMQTLFLALFNPVLFHYDLFFCRVQ